MASLPARLDVVIAPDLRALGDWFAVLCERAGELQEDARFADLLRRFALTLYFDGTRMVTCEVVDGRAVCGPSDVLLNYMAQFRALERVIDA